MAAMMAATTSPGMPASTCGAAAFAGAGAGAGAPGGDGTIYGTDFEDKTGDNK